MTDRLRLADLHVVPDGMTSPPFTVMRESR
jgi:hypothetical protein